MPRRKRGRPINGWLLIDKPLGVGSTSVVSKARWAFQAQKAGHAGTLDPLATGLLAVAFGEATKTVPYAMDGRKTYRFAVRWGAATQTDDLEGAIVATSERRPGRDEIEAALPAFIGEIQQRPPAYSAIKVDGARAYDLARAGAAPELAARPIWIESLTLIAAEPEEARFEMTCGKGGYVRSIARDLGESLGCFGHVTELRRIAAGPFRIEDAISFDLLDEFGNRSASESALLPVAAGLDDIPAFAVNREEADLLRQGRALRIAGAAASEGLPKDDAARATYWASLNGTPVAIGVDHDGEFRPSRVFNLEAPDVGAKALPDSADEDKDDDVDHN